ncbi:MAG: short-chain dehydrogenase, partial [Pseudomonadota bacterium]
LSPGTVATEMQRDIKASGINPVSQMDFDSHIPADFVARAIGYLVGPGGDAHLGADFSIKTNEGRAAVGLPPLS